MIDLNNILLKTGEPRISACMIVKNEEQNLRMSIPSFINEVDELIIVDTGSTDGTVEVATSFGDKVKLLHFEWCDDFSAARNVGLEQATGDWVIWFDADECLTQVADGRLKNLAKIAPVQLDGYLFKCNSQMDEHNIVSVWQWRMFRNYRTVRFVNKIHETPMRMDEQTVVYTQQFQASTAHWGYLNLDPELVKLKDQRNLRILRKLVATEPKNWLMRYYLGKQLHARNESAKALVQFKKAIELWKDQGSQKVVGTVMQDIYWMAVSMCWRLERFAEGLNISEDCPEEYGSVEIAYNEGLCWMAIRDWTKAAGCFTRCWMDPLLSCEDKSVATWRPLLMLSTIYAASGQEPLARGCLLKAMQVSENNPAIAQFIAATEEKLSMPVAA